MPRGWEGRSPRVRDWVFVPVQPYPPATQALVTPILTRRMEFGDRFGGWLIHRGACSCRVDDWRQRRLLKKSLKTEQATG
jgi:hypothetical protein